MRQPHVVVVAAACCGAVVRLRSKLQWSKAPCSTEQHVAERLAALPVAALLSCCVEHRGVGEGDGGNVRLQRGAHAIRVLARSGVEADGAASLLPQAGMPLCAGLTRDGCHATRDAT